MHQAVIHSENFADRTSGVHGQEYEHPRGSRIYVQCHLNKVAGFKIPFLLVLLNDIRKPGSSITQSRRLQVVGTVTF